MALHVEVGKEGVEAAEDLLDRLAAIARGTLQRLEVDDASISLTLMDDAAITRLNQQFLDTDGPTDVISFPLFEPGESAVGDVYIGYDQAQRQAAQHEVPLDQELARLTIHGTLHVMGYDHPENEDRERSEMWQLQESILAELYHT